MVQWATMVGLADFIKEKLWTIGQIINLPSVVGPGPL